MGSLPLPVLLGAAALGLGLALLVLVVAAGRDPARRAARANLLAPGGPAGGATLLAAAEAPRFGELEERVNRLLLAIVPEGVRRGTEAKLAAAGLTARLPIERALAMKAGLGVALLLLGLGSAVTGGGAASALVALIGAPVGFLVPDVLFGLRASSRREAILMALADTLDLMTITVEAGVAFESAMVRAGRGGRGPLAEEIIRTMQEMQAGVPRTEALHNLAGRCEVPDLTAFTSAVAQAERFGVPIARVLRVQSAELREKRRQRAEEAAMKLPTKVILPLALCILPAMMILVVGPSIIQIGRAFAQL